MKRDNSFGNANAQSGKAGKEIGWKSKTLQGKQNDNFKNITLRIGQFGS